MPHAAPTPARVLGRWLFHVTLVACWALVVVMALLTWGPHATRYKTEIIVGQSMEPTIPLWSVIVVEPVDPAEIREGDVIVAQPVELDNQKVTHRVTAIERGDEGERVFRTRGDNNETTDPWKVVYEDRGWRVVKHVPHVGWIMAKAQTRWSRVLLVALPILLILTQVLRWIWRDESRARSRREQLVDEWWFEDDLVEHDDPWARTG